MPKSDPVKLSKVAVSLPFGLGSAEWVPQPAERRAAYCLYVELVTRVAVEPLSLEEGSIREALTSLYSLFASTREVLKEAGPDIATGGNDSVGGIALLTLNKGLRPFLTRWHTALRDWESKRPVDLSISEHESVWPKAAECRAELSQLRSELRIYSVALGGIAGIVG